MHQQAKNTTPAGRAIRIALKIVALLLVCSTHAHADKPRDSGIFNFLINPQGKAFQIRAIKGPQFSLGKGFPFWWKNKGFALEDATTGKELKRFLPDERELGVLMMVYPLDEERIVINLVHDAGPRRYHTAIWNRVTNEHHVLAGTGSGWPYEASGVSPNETEIISVSYGKRAVLHDKSTGHSRELFPEYLVTCPRYSPDGTRYAFYGADPQGPMDKEHVLVIQHLDGSAPRRIVIENRPHRNEAPNGKTLAWSPSGAYLAGYLVHDTVHRLYLWASDGRLLRTVDMPFDAESWWAPVWLSDEKGVMIFSKERDHGALKSITVLVEGNEPRRGSGR